MGWGKARGPSVVGVARTSTRNHRLREAYPRVMVEGGRDIESNVWKHKYMMVAYFINKSFNLNSFLFMSKNILTGS